jgi:hypothetical protein
MFGWRLSSLLSNCSRPLSCHNLDVVTCADSVFVVLGASTWCPASGGGQAASQQVKLPHTLTCFGSYCDFSAIGRNMHTDRKNRSTSAAHACNPLTANNKNQRRHSERQVLACDKHATHTTTHTTHSDPHTGRDRMQLPPLHAT